MTLRRFASVMAAVGALLVSSGIALMVSPTSADATPGLHKDWVCKYVGTPGTGERLKSGNDGLVWVDTSATEDGTWFNDAHGSSYVLWANAPHDPMPDASQCPAGRVEISVDIQFVDATCDAGPSYFLTGDTGKVTVTESRTPEAGKSVTVTATAKSGYLFAGFENTYTETYKFKAAPTNCTVVDAEAAVSWVEPTCENENTVDYVKTTDVNVASWQTSGSWQPGGTVTVTATATAGHLFAGDPASQTTVFTHTFAAAELNCTSITPLEPSFVEPTCTTEPQVVLPTAPQEPAFRTAEPVVVGPVQYEVTGDLVAGGTVHVTASLVDPETTHWGEGATTSWDYTFVVPTGCTVVEPPVVEPPVVEPPTAEEAETVTPTVVHAGLAGAESSNSAEQQGLALMLTGLLLMAGAGGLVVAKGGDLR